jgi:hypothetical protein
LRCIAGGLIDVPRVKDQHAAGLPVGVAVVDLFEAHKIAKV